MEADLFPEPEPEPAPGAPGVGSDQATEVIDLRDAATTADLPVPEPGEDRP